MGYHGSLHCQLEQDLRDILLCAADFLPDALDDDRRQVIHILELLYRAYSESYENDPPEIREGFQELDTYLEKISLTENNTVFSLCCRLCVAYERKAFQDGVRYGAALMLELQNEK